MKLCNEEKEFEEFKKEPLDYSKKLHKNSLFLPMFSGLQKKDMLNVANSVAIVLSELKHKTTEK